MSVAGRNLVDEARFLHVVNLVLRSAGRPELAENGQHWTAIRVLPDDRVLQILAGPGSGKTEVLVWRVLYELLVCGTSASSILVTTFTNRAAKELQIRLVERSDAFLHHATEIGLMVDDPRIHDVLVGTIHSLCDRLLAEHDDAYVENGTQLIDESEVLARLMRTYRFTLGYNQPGQPQRTVNRLLNVPQLMCLYRPPWKDEANWPTTNIDRVKFLNQLIGQHTETWLPRCADAHAPNGVEQVHGPVGLTNDLIILQQRWEEYLDNQRILDYSTIQKRFVDRQHTLLNLFNHVFVDEFQDSNPIQFLLHTAWLGNAVCRLTVVGDDDQAVYRFRGSDLNCFNSVEPHCRATGDRYRLGKLETNYRSTRAIVGFSQRFKENTVLRDLSMPKQITHAPDAEDGLPVRLLEGRWEDLCATVAQELDSHGVGRIPNQGEEPPVSVAILMFSTSERSTDDYTAPALVLRRTLEAHGLRVYNPRNKTAGDPDTPIGQLLGLISYLIDPVTRAPVGKNGNMVEVWASNPKANYAAAATVTPPGYPISQDHINSFQKKLRKGNGGRLDAPAQDRTEVLAYVDTIRANLVQEHQRNNRPRLTLAGFVARLLAHPFFRDRGFTVDLFRQSLFTQLLEANIAPTRLTMQSLDNPLEVTVVNGKIIWPDRYWQLLGILGSYLRDTHLDDPEVEVFEEGAVPLITFHQAKGLEFDHVYVAAMGREPDVSPALRTQLFSGQAVAYARQNGRATTTDLVTLYLAEGDRDRENYVALTRAKTSLTVFVDNGHDGMFMRPSTAVRSAFDNSPVSAHPSVGTVTVKVWPHA